jgi:hypothetical protein
VINKPHQPQRGPAPWKAQQLLLLERAMWVVLKQIGDFGDGFYTLANAASITAEMFTL